MQINDCGVHSGWAIVMSLVTDSLKNSPETRSDILNGFLQIAQVLSFFIVTHSIFCPVPCNVKIEDCSETGSCVRSAYDFT